MGNPPSEDVSPIQKWWISIARLVYQRVHRNVTFPFCKQLILDCTAQESGWAGSSFANFPWITFKGKWWMVPPLGGFHPAKGPRMCQDFGMIDAEWCEALVKWKQLHVTHPRLAQFHPPKNGTFEDGFSSSGNVLSVVLNTGYLGNGFKDSLGGGFKYFLVSPVFGEDFHFDKHIFSDGLKPPTSNGFKDSLFALWFFGEIDPLRLAVV